MARKKPKLTANVGTVTHKGIYKGNGNTMTHDHRIGRLAIMN